MGGRFWEFRDRYIQNSPFFYLDSVAMPRLIFHGGADDTQAASETFVALRRLGKEVVLVRYDGEAHWPGEWSFANIVHYWQRIFAWCQKHLLDVGR